MQEEVLAIAIVRPYPGKDAEVLAVLRDLYATLAAKGYSRDELYRDTSDDRLFNLRYWKTEDSRRHAYDDPDIQQCWLRLSQVCEVEQVYGKLHRLTENWTKAAGSE
ncbi:MAG TPA: antibiotic biosynthesis monooxygenase [Terriglobales bacterium]|nr:antibiotic biosynthesis monooxygenase [Terriglobales bacterium]